MPKDKDFDEKKQHLENDRTREAAADKAKPRCSICGKYTDKKTSPQCFGHGGGGGGGGSSGESTSKGEGKGLDNTPSITTDVVASSNNVMTERMTDPSFGLQPQFDEKPFNPEIISELLSKRLLLIDNDRDLGTLTIKLLCNLKDLSPEQRNEFKKFIDTILNELEEFKKENGISNRCNLPEYDKEGNILSLRIALPTQTFYEAFILRLASKNLLPIQNIEQKAKERVTYQEGINLFNPTPLSAKPIPSANRKAEDEEAHKKSSIRPKSPLDGLKP